MEDRATQEDVFRRLAYLYAQAIDRSRPELLDQVFHPDAAVELWGNTYQGVDSLKQLMAALRIRYPVTYHAVLNQTIECHGDDASGETYCIASHLQPAPGETTLCYEMAIRYQDRFARRGGAWRFSRRQLLVDWTRVHQVRPGAAMTAPMTSDLTAATPALPGGSDHAAA